MDDHTRTALIVAACTIAVILVLLYIVWKFCYKDGKFICTLQDEETTRIIPSKSKKGFKKQEILLKRCEQSSTREIENRIIDRLNPECRMKSWNQNQDDGERPIIVFCVISSRIGTDIENAMNGVNGNSRVVLVLLHSVPKDLLRGDLSDDEELLDTTMRNRMTGIAHFAFSDREGLYDCYQNTTGFHQLANIVNSLD